MSIGEDGYDACDGVAELNECWNFLKILSPSDFSQWNHNFPASYS